MPTIEETLTQIQSRLDAGQALWPEQRLTELIEQMGPAELSDWRTDIEMLVNKFHKKRRNTLWKFYSEQIGAPREPAAQSPEIAGPYVTIGPESPLVRDFKHTLQQLREYHIFHWSTFYRDGLASHFEKFLTQLRRVAPDDLADALADPLAEHARDVFSAGYDHTRRKGHVHEDAIRRAVNGLGRFLALPLELYAARSSTASDSQSAFALRLLLSAAVTGILKGCSLASFDNETGRAILPRFPRSWMHCAAFLLPRHAEGVIDGLASGSLSDGLQTSVLPALDGLQKFFDVPATDYFPLPVTGQYSWSRRRLDIAVRPPANAQRLIEVSAFLEEGFVSTSDLEDATGRQVTLVIAPLRPDVQKVLSERPALHAIVVPADRDRLRTAERGFAVWREAVDKLRSRLNRNSPITHNFAQEFPLQKPDKARFFHVARTSVRDLLRTFERGNGVRLWCSVRRSGKTTACLDLDSTSGDSKIVSQTCGDELRWPGARRFYESVRQALKAGEMLSETFVKEAVSDCAAPVDVENRRVVLVLDEYETLFGHLDAAAENSRLIRFNVVQPILNQLASFAHENLLVFLGQKPDAHFILMAQNQLAPYVTQMPFPLFEHMSGTTNGEFSALVNKILGERVECASGFLDALFEETAGHPFLTANVLVEFVDWLMEKKRPQSSLSVNREDFVEFAKHRLKALQIGKNSPFGWFAKTAQDAMSVRGFRDDSWLFAAYWVLRTLSSGSVDEFGMQLADFQEMIKRIPVPHEGELPDTYELLQSASQANFLDLDDGHVSVKIRTLGRIASAVRPGLA